MVRTPSNLGALAFLFSAVLAKEIPANDTLAALRYDNGLVHAEIIAMKNATWEAARESGLMDSSLKAELDFAPCVNGIAEAVAGDASNTFKCKNADLYHFLSHADLGSTGEGSSSWGWTSDTGREFVAIGQQDGTAFVEINSEGKMLYLGRLPQYSVTSIWREIRSFKNYMIIGSEASGHGIQIFDMTKLLDINPSSPVIFNGKTDLAGHYGDLPTGSTHNVVVNEELNYAVAVGAVPRAGGCRAGLIFIDLTDPTNPTSPGCAAGDGYVHDAECVVYRGPHTEYVGRDICYGYNEDTLTIYDVTDKNDVTNIISRTSYEGARYSHQGSVLDKMNQEFLLLDDELDEQGGAGPAVDGYPITYIWDIRDLEAPKQTGYYKGSTRSIDHNQYVIDGLAYQSNYGAGLRVLDVTSIPTDPTGASVCEAAFFDIYPEDDNANGGGSVSFVGTWSAYANFKSGYVFINTIERGAFVVKLTSKTC